MSKFLRRSEYQHALNLARQGRRRGDVVAAERWLKHADRQLALAQRFNASMDAASLGDAEFAAAQARECLKREELLQARAYASLQQGIRKIEESFREEST